MGRQPVPLNDAAAEPGATIPEVPPTATAADEPPRPSFWRQLRFKVIAPYLALALILAIAGTYFLARVLAERMHERLLNQLWEAGHYATDQVVYVERELLTSLRAIARTQGVAEALQQPELDRERLRDLVYPIAANAGLELVEITDTGGTVLLSLHRNRSITGTLRYSETHGSDLGDWPLVQRVQQQELDDIGDKFAGLVRTPEGWRFYISGPIKDTTDGHMVGVVLVGIPVPQLVARMAGQPSANPAAAAAPTGRREITIYDADGQVIASTLATIPPISADFYRQVQEEQDLRYLGRRLHVAEQEIELAFGSFDARHGADLAVFSVALPSQQQEQALTQLAMAALFSLAVVAVVLLGIWVSAQIVRPIRDLVHAAGRVEQGDLAQKVVVSTDDEIGLLAHAFNRMVQGLRVKEYIRDAFGRFVSRDVSESLLRGEIRLQGEKRVTSMLFADIRDFTRLSEQYAPDVMVRILNDYFTAMVEVAQQCGGTVNKFGGDSTLVIFGAPVYHADHADRAVQAALGMRRRLAQLNAARLTRGEVPIRMGIGINTGEVVAGTVGSSDRMEYTVIGDAVNLSARVQGLNKEFPEYDIMISEYTLAALVDRERYAIRSLGAMTLKGKTGAVGIYAVIGLLERDDGKPAGT